MLKKTVTYPDYNGNERTEDFYFNLTKAEITKMELGVKGGLAELIDRAVKSEDGPTIIKVFEDIVAKSYGIKSPDGKRFIKTPEILEEFTQTEAYSIIFMELATDADAASKFINGIIPADMAQQLEAQNN